MPSLFDIPQALGAAILLGIIYLAYWQLTVGAKRRALIKQYGCLPIPHIPCKDPILGIDKFRKVIKAFKERRGLEHIADRFKTMGVNTFQLPVLGRQIIATIEPENLKTVQALKFKDYSLGRQRKINFQPFLGPGIFTTNGAEWQHSREMLRPNFVRSQVADLDTFETHVSHLIGAIPRNGETVDLQDLFFRLTMDSATEFLFGESTNCLAPGLSSVSAAEFAESFNRGQETLAQWGRYGNFSFLVAKNNFKSDAKYVHSFIDAYVDKGLAKRSTLLSEKPNQTGRYIFIDELVRQTDDRYRIRSELLNILLAGRDTTASLLSNVWHILARRPDIWAKLRAEVHALGTSRPTFEQIKDLKYLRAVINESLRLHPVVPQNSREAVVDTVLPLGGGPDGKAPCLVKKKQLVTWSVYAMHRRKDFYGEDADEFNPERWLGPKGLRPGWEYLPFNGGPRICLGQQFALMEASYTTIRLVQEFVDVQSRDPEPWREWLTLTCTGAGGCKVALTPS